MKKVIDFVKKLPIKVGGVSFLSMIENCYSYLLTKISSVLHCSFRHAKEKLHYLYLDIISMPSFFMTRKTSAKYHLKYVCNNCPNHRRILRDVENKCVCWWNYNWQKENYNISKNFGITNFFKQYLLRKR